MNPIVKEYADNRQISLLKFVFVDALDVDPTFEHYIEEYEYCKNVPGLFEPYVELTPFTQDTSKWDESYWTKLKTDLIKNFSDLRMRHMREVAQVFLAEKIARLLAERKATAKTVTQANTFASNPVPQTRKVSEPSTHIVRSPQELEQDRMLEEKKRRLEEENKRWEAMEQESALCENQSNGGILPKKILGVAVAVIILAVAIALVLILA